METALVLWWLVCATLSALIAGRKGYSAGVWLVLGFLFGIFALIVVASLPNQRGDQEH